MDATTPYHNLPYEEQVKLDFILFTLTQSSMMGYVKVYNIV